MTFHVSALPAQSFERLFSLSDDALAAHGGVRRVADRHPGFPCRVSLRDATAGENVLLVHFEHHPVPSPFRSSHAIYVREGARQAHPELGEIPEMLRSRLLSVRAFDGAAMIVDAEVVEGGAIEGAIQRLLGDRRTAYLHLHFARAGCFAARVDRRP